MTSPRVYFDTELISGSEIILAPEICRHLITVLRCKPGSPVRIFNGRGGEFQATLTRVTKSEVTARLEKHLSVDVESPVRVSLVQAMLKADRMDFAIQKSVEMGVASIRPMLTQRSVKNLRGDRLNKKVRHWRRVITSACEQSGRNTIPHLLDPLPLGEAITQHQEPKFLLSPSAATTLSRLRTRPFLTILSGPEGGFTAQELNEAESMGCDVVRLGPRTLRAETAPLAALAAIQARWGDFA